MQVRYDQKMAKYGQLAEQNNLRFIPAVFSHTGQIHDEFKILVKEQIRRKLIANKRIEVCIKKTLPKGLFCSLRRIRFGE